MSLALVIIGGVTVLAAAYLALLKLVPDARILKIAESMRTWVARALDDVAAFLDELANQQWPRPIAQVGLALLALGIFIVSGHLMESVIENRWLAWIATGALLTGSYVYLAVVLSASLRARMATAATSSEEDADQEENDGPPDELKRHFEILAESFLQRRFGPSWRLIASSVGIMATVGLVFFGINVYSLSEQRRDVEQQLAKLKTSLDSAFLEANSHTPSTIGKIAIKLETYRIAELDARLRDTLQMDLIHVLRRQIELAHYQEGQADRHYRIYSALRDGSKPDSWITERRQEMRDFATLLAEGTDSGEGCTELILPEAPEYAEMHLEATRASIRQASGLAIPVELACGINHLESASLALQSSFYSDQGPYPGGTPPEVVDYRNLVRGTAHRLLAVVASELRDLCKGTAPLLGVIRCIPRQAQLESIAEDLSGGRTSFFSRHLQKLLVALVHSLGDEEYRGLKQLALDHLDAADDEFEKLPESAPFLALNHRMRGLIAWGDAPQLIDEPQSKTGTKHRKVIDHAHRAWL